MSHAASTTRLNNAETVNIWALPDMSVLSAGRRNPPPLPTDIFGSSWPLIADFAEGSGAPVDYVAIGFLTVAASLIGGKRRVRPYSTANWQEPCIIWSAVVGDPSSNKSPALDAVSNPLRLIEADHALSHGSDILRWETECERAKVEKAAWQENVKAAVKDNLGVPSMPETAIIPDEPVRRRLLVQDATPEAVGAILAGNPSGTLHLRDELAGWLNSFDRYSPGGREFWLEAFRGSHHVIDRKGSTGPISIEFNGVSVLGSIQPEKLASCLLNGADDGLVARFLWAWPDPVPYRRPRQIADEGKLREIYRWLDALPWGTGFDGRRVAVTIPLDDAAATLFERWTRGNQEGLEDAGSLYKGFCGKLTGLVLRLALTSALIDAAVSGSPEPKTISARTLAAVCEFVDGYAKPSALRVFGDAALPIVERHAATLARYIRRHKMHRINAREMKRPPHRLPGMTEAGPLNAAIEFLTEANWLHPIGSRAGDNPGRKSADFAVNPAVHGGDHG